MINIKNSRLLIIILLASVGLYAFVFQNKKEDARFITHIVNLEKQDLAFYWKDEAGKRFGNIHNLKKWAESKSNRLVFAVNGGMYKKDGSPQGLYIENSKKLIDIDLKQKGYGNFYMQPNGVFYITNDNMGVVCKTTDFTNKNIKFATQSGPMLLINGKMHHRFIKGSDNLNIRNGVGILPNNNLVFVMSKEKINFYDFASYFKSLGCKNALYLDGFVSKTYLPEKDSFSLDGDFGVIIGEIEKGN